MTVFESSDYKRYLSSKVGGPQQKKGVKSAMARALGCQPTYISHVLNGHANLSLEQAEVLNSFFAHTKEEGQIFLLMVMRDRAGTHTLKTSFQEQIDVILANRLVLTRRLGANRNVLTEEQRGVFYSVWYFLAIQIGLTIPEWRTHDALAARLGLPIARVVEALKFLCEAGVVRKDGDRFIPTENHFRLDQPHHLIKHHTNWRVRGLEALERAEPQNMHYSGVWSLSAADVTRIKDLLLEQLKSNLKIVTASPEERLYALNIDFFNLAKN